MSNFHQGFGLNTTPTDFSRIHLIHTSIAAYSTSYNNIILYYNTHSFRTSPILPDFPPTPLHPDHRRLHNLRVLDTSLRTVFFVFRIREFFNIFALVFVFWTTVFLFFSLSFFLSLCIIAKLRNTQT